MKVLYSKIIMAITAILFVLGIMIIISATSLGQKEGTKAIWKNGGSIETDRYNWVIQSTTLNYRTAGSIIAMIGGCGLVLSGTAVYREMIHEK